MDSKRKSNIIRELLWLAAIIVVSGIIEYFIILLLDLHPILSIKIQAFIGLIIIAYCIRMIARMGKKGIIKFTDDKNHGLKNHKK